MIEPQKDENLRPQTGRWPPFVWWAIGNLGSLGWAGAMNASGVFKDGLSLESAAVYLVGSIGLTAIASYSLSRILKQPVDPVGVDALCLGWIASSIGLAMQDLVVKVMPPHQQLETEARILTWAIFNGLTALATVRE